MSREEEIGQASELAYTYSNGVFTNGMRECFIKGAEWADKHPREELWDSEKVIWWLKKNCTYIHPRKGTEECFINFNALKEAMED